MRSVRGGARGRRMHVQWKEEKRRGEGGKKENNRETGQQLI